MNEKDIPRNSHRSTSTKSCTSSLEDFPTVSSHSRHSHSHHNHHYECDPIGDDLRQRRSSVVQSLRLVLEARALCKRANKDYRGASLLLEKAQKSFRRPTRKLSSRSSDDDDDSGLSGLRGSYHRGKGGRCRNSARTKALSALEDLKAAYTMLHRRWPPRNNGGDIETSEEAAARVKANAVVVFLRENYGPWMTHIGTGLLPAVRGGEAFSNAPPPPPPPPGSPPKSPSSSTSKALQTLKSDVFLGHTISARQIDLMAAVASRIREDLANLEMARASRSSSVSASRFHSPRIKNPWSLRSGVTG